MKFWKKLLLTAITASLCLGCFSPAGINAGAASEAAVAMIVTNPAEDASTSMNVGFHAELGYTNCYVQYTLKSDTEWANAKNQTGSFVVYGADETTNPFYNTYSKDAAGENYYQTYRFLDYSVTLANLTPATEYMYRVCDGARFSDTYYFKTAGADEWSFAVTGDFHEYYDTYGTDRAGNATKAVNAAIALADNQSLPSVEHIVSVGDIVAWGVSYNQWQLVLNQSYIKNYSFANSIGNHDDMDRFGNSSSAYNSIVFNNPKNGYGDEVGTCFYYLYNNVLFIYINYLDPSAEAEEWATQVVNSMVGQYKYSVLVNHRPATNKYGGGTYSYFWNYWADFCDTHKIDLVLAGDHHVYMRSQPLYNGSKVTDYGPSNPDGTVYIAGDSADGERGSSTDVVSSFDSDIVASTYFRYRYTSSTADITSMLVTVKEDKMEVKFVYYENKGSAEASSDFYEGSIEGHANFHYGDTSYVYPSDHTVATGTVTPPEEETEKNLISADLGGEYMYSTDVYPGSASYYDRAYYGDNANQGGAYISGKLNDGVFAANSDPGNANVDWAVFFKSMGKPDITFKLKDSATVNSMGITYRGYTGASYSGADVSELLISEDGETFTPVTGYTTNVTIENGNNYKLNISFAAPVTAKYIQLKLDDPKDGASRFAVCEVEIMGNAPWTDIEHTVEFKDYDGTLLDTVQVKDGESAAAPALSLRADYHFVGWDKDYNCVKEDMVITAVYSDDECEVVFVDYDGTEISRQTVAFGAAATAPADPTREEYVFMGWDKPFEAVAGDVTVTATYIHESELDAGDEEEPVIPIPVGDNILLNRPYSLDYNQFLGANTDDNRTLLTDGKYRGDGTNPWPAGIALVTVTVEFAGSSKVNSASFTFDTATDIGVIVFKSVKVTGNRGFAVGGISYTTDGTTYQEAEVEVTQVAAENAPDSTAIDFRVKADIKGAKGVKICWTNNGEYVSNFDEIQAFSAYKVEGEEDDSSSSEDDNSSSSEDDNSSSSEDNGSDDITYGDVNGDGNVNSLDAAQVLKHDAMLIELGEDALKAADVNGDGQVNSLDAAQILKFDAMIIDKFPVEQA
ncbi:MAG: fibronectin type III domain-containing protein [Clostridia bacterium]|nr:fibronectin type III domain-containing protein [Clostridia bacterium]